jgi:bifunctional DNase/RNase
MQRMIIEGVGFDHNKQTVVVLKDSENQKLLPIWIGPSEAKAIALELEGARPSRPLSHDLLLAAIHMAEGSVTQVVINDLLDSTFFATIDIQTPAGELHIDARPSDAIAVAVRAKCPVFVDGGAENALIEMSEANNGETDEEAADPFEGGSTPGAGNAEEIERFKRLLGDLDD